MACPFDCQLCPAAGRCGRTPNFCGRSCPDDPLLQLEVRRALFQHLGGLDLRWPRPIAHPRLQELPDHLPVLVQAYTDPLALPWVAFHGGRLLGRTGRRLTPKHRRPLREVYRLGPETRIALELYVEDRVLEGLWRRRRELLPALAELGLDLLLTPNFSVWRDACRFEQLVQQRRAFILYHELLEAGLPAVPDVGWSRFEPDGRRWAEWINGQPALEAVSIFCGTKRIHPERRAHQESVEDLGLFHRVVRPEVAFILGGVSSPRRLLDYRRAAPGRRLVVCNGQAYALAQRRRLLGRNHALVARSARHCFLRNCAWNDRVYAALLRGSDAL